MAGLSGLRVLVVEDEYFIARSLARIVEEAAGETVGPARDLQSARHLLADAEVDVALLDIDIRGTSVFPFAVELSAKGVPYLFVTGYGRGGIEPGHEGRPVISKPFEDSAIVEGILLARSGTAPGRP